MGHGGTHLVRTEVEGRSIGRRQKLRMQCITCDRYFGHRISISLLQVRGAPGDWSRGRLLLVKV